MANVDPDLANIILSDQFQFQQGGSICFTRPNLDVQNLQHAQLQRTLCDNDSNCLILFSIRFLLYLGLFFNSKICRMDIRYFEASACSNLDTYGYLGYEPI